MNGCLDTSFALRLARFRRHDDGTLLSSAWRNRAASPSPRPPTPPCAGRSPWASTTSDHGRSRTSPSRSRSSASESPQAPHQTSHGSPRQQVRLRGAARGLCQTRSRITATSVIASAARLGTSTAAPEAKARIATQSNGLSTKRGTARSSFPDVIQRISNRLRSSGRLRRFDASGQPGTKHSLRVGRSTVRQHHRREGIATALYYFDISKGPDLMRDDEGSEFASPEAAAQGAARSAAEIGTGRLAKSDFSDVVIEVRDGRNQRLCTVTASMTVDWHAPQLQHHSWSA